MKKINHFIGKLFVGAIALGMIAMAGRASAEDIQQYITVVKVEGNARYSSDAMKSWAPLKKGMVLKPGALIQTAEDGTVDVLLGERQSVSPSMLASSSVHVMSSANDNGPKANVVRIFSSSVMVVDKLSLQKTDVDEVSETQLDLRAGKIMGNVKKLSSASHYEVKIPNGVAGIRGTTFMIGANGTVYVLSGSVVISYMNSQNQLVTQVVQAGYSYNAFTPNPQPTQLTQAQLTALQTQYKQMGGPANTPGASPTKNGTTIYISPN